MASLKNINVYTLLPATSVPAGHKIIGSRWVYKVKADNSHKGRVVVLGWGQLPGIDCGSTFAPVYRLQSIRMVLSIAAEYNLECWQLVQHRVSERRCHRGNLRQDGTRIRAIRRKRSPTGNEAFEKPIRPPPEPDQLVEHDRQTSGGNWLQNSHVGPVRLHLLGVRRH